MTIRDYNPKTVNPGQPVNILGDGFKSLSGVKVKFGPYDAAETNVRNDQHIQARVPAVGNGVFGLILEYSAGGGTVQEFVGPGQVGPSPAGVGITDFYPDTLPAAGGALSLFGYRFSDHADGGGTLEVVFNSFNPRTGGFLASVPGTNPAIVNDTMIAVTAPSAADLRLSATNSTVFQINVTFPDGTVVVFSGGPDYQV